VHREGKGGGGGVWLGYHAKYGEGGKGGGEKQIVRFLFALTKKREKSPLSCPAICPKEKGGNQAMRVRWQCAADREKKKKKKVLGGTRHFPLPVAVHGCRKKGMAPRRVLSRTEREKKKREWRTAPSPADFLLPPRRGKGEGAGLTIVDGDSVDEGRWVAVDITGASTVRPPAWGGERGEKKGKSWSPRYASSPRAWQLRQEKERERRGGSVLLLYINSLPLVRRKGKGEEGTPLLFPKKGKRGTMGVGTDRGEGVDKPLFRSPGGHAQ